MKRNEWTRSSRCNFEKPQCVEVGLTEFGVFVRDSKDPVHVLAVEPAQWAAFVEHVTSV